MDRTLTPEELYAFDCQGFFVWRGALAQVDLEACRSLSGQALHGGQSAASRQPPPPPRLAAVEALALAILRAGGAPASDRGPGGLRVDSPLTAAPEHVDAAVELGAQGDLRERERLGCDCHGGPGRGQLWSGCRGVRAFVATGDTARLSAAPGTHNTGALPPPGALALPGVLRQLALRAGDVAVLAATTLYSLAHGGAQQLFTAVYASAVGGTLPSVGYQPLPAPGWLGRLSPEALAIVGPREGVFEPAAAEAATRPRSPAVDGTGAAPGGLSGQELAERWVWDTQGVLAVPGVMDDGWVASALGALEALAGADGSYPAVARYERGTMGEPLPTGPVRLEVLRDAALDDADVSPSLAGTPRLRLRGLYALEPRALAEPFLAMAAHPPIVHRLGWMLGEGFVEQEEGHAAVGPLGTSGQQLHGGEGGARPSGSGAPTSVQVNLAWQLRATTAGEGGLCCVHGSQKAPWACVCLRTAARTALLLLALCCYWCCALTLRPIGCQAAVDARHER
jgi:hypothetical protein